MGILSLKIRMIHRHEHGFIASTPKKRNQGKRQTSKSKRDVHTFIPGIWTHSTAVPVAFDRNSDKVSSAMDIILQQAQQTLLASTMKKSLKKTVYTGDQSNF